MTQLETFLADVNRKIDDALDTLVPAVEIEPKRLNEAIRWSLFGGGKRFRPALMLAVGASFGVSDDLLLRTAAAVEMIHTYSLIHDDLPAMDDDDLRRGRATCHKQFDEATAILAGDALQVLAFEAIANDEKLPVEIRLRLVSGLAAAAAKMVAGQQLDLEAEGKDAAIADIEYIHRHKTGALIMFSANAGAIIGGASDEELMAVSNFAAKLGLLFQISDDILDVTQSTKTLGKTAAKDVSSRKATYPSIYGVDGSRKMLGEIYGEAIAELEKLDTRTNLLDEIASFVFHRES